MLTRTWPSRPRTRTIDQTLKAKDQDKDQTPKNKDEDKDQAFKAKDQEGLGQL